MKNRKYTNKGIISTKNEQSQYTGIVYTESVKRPESFLNVKKKKKLHLQVFFPPKGQSRQTGINYLKKKKKTQQRGSGELHQNLDVIQDSFHFILVSAT